MLEFSRVRKVKSPERGTSGSAGIDFFIPDKDPEFIKSLLEKNPQGKFVGRGFDFIDNPSPGLIIYPHESILIPSGIHVRIPKGFALVAFNKSGVCTKKGLFKGSEIIDEDYSGEIHHHLINSTNYERFIRYGEKIIQYLLIPIDYCGLTEKNSLIELYKDFKTDRGVGGFGSTN